MADFRDDLERELVEAARRQAAARGRAPRRSAAVAVAAVAAAVLLVIVLRPAGDAGRSTLAGRGTVVGQDVTLPGALWRRPLPHAGGTGPERSLADFATHPVVVIFSATWCQPCDFDRLSVRAHDRARRAAELLRQRGVEVLLIAYHDDDSSRLARARLGPGVRFLDPGGRLARALGVRSAPAVVLLDSFGRVVARAHGPLDTRFAARQIRRLRLPRISWDEFRRLQAFEHPNESELDQYRPLGGDAPQPNDPQRTAAPPLALP